jgi:hypothetical protein
LITIILLIVVIVAIIRIDWEKVFDKYVGDKKQ